MLTAIYQALIQFVRNYPCRARLGGHELRTAGDVIHFLDEAKYKQYGFDVAINRTSYGDTVARLSVHYMQLEIEFQERFYSDFVQRGNMAFIKTYRDYGYVERGMEVNSEGAIYKAVTAQLKIKMPMDDPDAAITAWQIVQRIQAAELHPEDSLLVRALSDELGPPPAIPQLPPREGENPDEGDAWVEIAAVVDKVINDGLKKPTIDYSATGRLGGVDFSKLEDYALRDMYVRQRTPRPMYSYDPSLDFKFNLKPAVSSNVPPKTP